MSRSDSYGLLLVAAAGVCCALPILVASGALGVIGGLLARAWPLVLLGAALLVLALARSARGHAARRDRASHRRIVR